MTRSSFDIASRFLREIGLIRPSTRTPRPRTPGRWYAVCPFCWFENREAWGSPHASFHVKEPGTAGEQSRGGTR